MSDEQVTESVEEETAPVQEESTEEVVEEREEEVGFNKKQMQQIGSVLGNMLKKSIENDVMPVIESNRRAEPNLYTGGGDNPAKKMFNERLQEMIFSGDVMGAIEEVQRVQQRANQNLTQQQTSALNKELTGYAERDNYKDIYSEMEGMAKQLVGEGWPPKAAAEHAYAKSRMNFLAGGSSDGSAFEMTTGGRRVPSQKKPKLPPQFKAAYERDKAKGLFKTEQEFIDNLAPQVRAELGL